MAQFNEASIKIPLHCRDCPVVCDRQAQIADRRDEAGGIIRDFLSGQVERVANNLATIFNHSHLFKDITSLDFIPGICQQQATNLDEIDIEIGQYERSLAQLTLHCRGIAIRREVHGDIEFQMATCQSPACPPEAVRETLLSMKPVNPGR